MRSLLVLIILLLSQIFVIHAITSDCTPNPEICNQTDIYEDYVECVRRQKRSIPCWDAETDCNCTDDCNCEEPEESCKICCNSPTCCEKTCNSRCKVPQCRSSCRTNCKKVPRRRPEIAPNEKAKNFTSIVNVYNILNTTSIPCNNTNVNVINLITTNPNQPRNCCLVIGPRQCYYYDFFNSYCYQDRKYECGPICTSAVVYTPEGKTPKTNPGPCPSPPTSAPAYPDPLPPILPPIYPPNISSPGLFPNPPSGFPFQPRYPPQFFPRAQPNFCYWMNQIAKFCTLMSLDGGINYGANFNQMPFPSSFLQIPSCVYFNNCTNGVDSKIQFDLLYNIKELLGVLKKRYNN